MFKGYGQFSRDVEFGGRSASSQEQVSYRRDKARYRAALARRKEIFPSLWASAKRVRIETIRDAVGARDEWESDSNAEALQMLKGCLRFALLAFLEQVSFEGWVIIGIAYSKKFALFWAKPFGALSYNVVTTPPGGLMVPTKEEVFDSFAEAVEAIKQRGADMVVESADPFQRSERK